jgi:hypothetical protein
LFVKYRLTYGFSIIAIVGVLVAEGKVRGFVSQDPELYPIWILYFPQLGH